MNLDETQAKHKTVERRGGLADAVGRLSGRSLVPLVKKRDFGMTPGKRANRTTVGRFSSFRERL
jgi:hypothetical protein